MESPPIFSPPTLAIRDRALAPLVIEAGREWPVVVDIDPSPGLPRLAGVYLRCARCGQGVARLAQGEPGDIHAVVATVQALEAGVLAHVLQVHRRDVDPGWSGT